MRLDFVYIKMYIFKTSICTLWLMTELTRRSDQTQYSNSPKLWLSLHCALRSTANFFPHILHFSVAIYRPYDIRMLNLLSSGNINRFQYFIGISKFSFALSNRFYTYKIIYETSTFIFILLLKIKLSFHVSVRIIRHNNELGITNSCYHALKVYVLHL